MIPAYNQKTFRRWSELELFQGVLYGEARGEPWSGKVAVGITICTRVEHPYFGWGENWREVILWKNQFSCFRKDDPNRKKIIEARAIRNNAWIECGLIAEAIYLGKLKDYTKLKPTFYHAKTILPCWAEKYKRIMIIGKHIFYTNLEDKK